MMPDENPFLEGYVSQIRGDAEVCPYVEGSGEAERWCRGFGGKPVAKKPISIPVAEGRRPFVEGYKSMILATRFGKKDACPYDEGTTEYERWTKGFRGPIAAKALAALTAH